MTLPPVRPDGKLPTVTSYLQMLAPPLQPPRPLPAGSLVLPTRHITISFYRYLYNTIGQAYLWGDRRKKSDEQLAEIIHHPLVEIFVLYVEGVPAGYVELDRRQPPEIELGYFGLIPEFVGRGYGLAFLQWAVDKAWSYQPSRFWVHTDKHDHPNALASYQKAGFVLYKQEEELFDDPRFLGLM